MTRGVEHARGPIAKGARGIVRCTCGFACDTVAQTSREAIDDMKLRHRHDHAVLAYEAVDYSGQPLSSR